MARRKPTTTNAPALAPTGQARAALDAYVTDVAAALQLRDWTIELKFDGLEEGDCAQVDALYGQRRATVTLGEVFRTQSPSDQRDTIVHELLHLVLMPSWQYIEELFDAELTARASRVAWLAYTQHVEYSVDQLAGVIAPTVALPPTLAWETPADPALTAVAAVAAAPDPAAPGATHTAAHQAAKDVLAHALESPARRIHTDVGY
jgi:hypothetical protein